MVAPIAYKVISEFKFEVADALINADALQNKVQSLSDTANHAIENILNLGSRFALEVSGLGGGLLNFFTKAIFASDKFRDSQLSFANIISSNMEHLTGSIGSFNDRMMVSKNIMNDIQKDAQKFGLPAGDLLSMTKSLSAELAPKGLAGENFGGARTMARNFLKSAPNLNIDPTLAQGQLLRAIEGSASLGDTLFKRLLTEAPEAFAQVGIKGAKGASETFNKLSLEKRFGVLNSALGKFASDMDILSGRANLLSVLMGRINDLFSGFTSILKPIGDVLIPPLVQLINQGIDLIQTDGAQLVKQFARFLKPFVEEPKKLFLDLMQLKSLASDIGSAGGITSFLITIMHIEEFLNFLNSFALGKDLLTGISGFIGKSKVLTYIFDLLGKGIAVVTKIMGGGFLVVIGKALALFGLLTVIFQAMSRANAMTKLDSFFSAIKASPAVAEGLNRIKEAFSLILQPIFDIIDGLAYLFSGSLAAETGLNITTKMILGFASGLEFLGTIVNGTWTIVRTVFAGFISFFFELGNTILDVIGQITSGNFKGIFDAIDIGGSLDNIADDMMQEFLKNIKRNVTDVEQNADTTAVVRNVVNIGKVENNFDIKEQVEPDRIAFTIEESLNKVANNPTRSGSRSLKGAFRTGKGVNNL